MGKMEFSATQCSPRETVIKILTQSARSRRGCMAESNAADGRKKHWLRWIEKSKELCGRDGILCDSVFSA